MLSLAAVSAGYGPFRVLSDVSLEVPQGEAVGVIGPNGAGKTTLMRVISGLVQFYTGAMTLEDAPLQDSRRTAWSSKALPTFRRTDVYFPD
jgi:branched-chain amino acid transport system ATP-binding protein